MTITQHGPKCDVCGGYMLFDKSMNFFTITGIDRELSCHDDCKPKLEQAMNTGDWKDLPEGPLRTAFAKAYEKTGGVS